MRSAISKELKACFKKRMKEAFPQFTPAKGAGIGKRPLYQWRPKAGLVCYLGLEIASGMDDDFTVEVAWSRKRRFPLGLVSFSPYEKSRKGKPVDEICVRLPCFWSETDWWELAKKRDAMDMIRSVIATGDMGLEPIEDVLPRVPAKVEEAMEGIRAHAIPYFEKIAAGK